MYQNTNTLLFIIYLIPTVLVCHDST